MYVFNEIHFPKKETYKGILGIFIHVFLYMYFYTCILNQTFSVTLLDIESECLLLKH
jgi:hypothetical protein